MYTGLLFFHSLTRWFLLISLVYAILIAFRGYFFNKEFSKWHNAIRHWTATIAHIQLILGVILFIKSPIIQYFFKNYQDAKTNEEISFFAQIHSLLMLSAVVLITIGSAVAKRKNTDKAKYKTMLTWFCIALFIILVALPWPFSPLASRPYLRPL
ncbi:hypothetical protein CNR22_17910 [Sphingobacteriaceae bacterium]|nr:hypothetical protein CNR22_17910 [Sphingobacteriaceae bacterium]